MFRKILVFVSMVIVISLVISNSALAQTPQPASHKVDDLQLENAPSGELGQSGTSFRYISTFGQREAPYFDDSSHLNFPVGLAVDQNNSVYILEQNGSRVLKYDQSGTFLYKIGKAGVNFNDIYNFDNPQDAVVDQNNNVWVADANRVVKYSPGGTFLLQFPADNPWQSGNGNDRFDNVKGVAFDATGRLYVSDSNNQRVQVFTLDSNGNPVWVKTLGTTGQTASDNAHFQYPQHIAIGNNQLFVVDSENHRVQVFDVSSANPDEISYLATIGVSGQAGSDNNHLDYPFGVTVNQDYIVVSEGNNNRIQAFRASDRQYVTTIAWFGNDPGFVWNPRDVAFDTLGNLYIADSYYHRVQFFSKGTGASWTYNRMIGTTNVPYLTDDYHFNKPRIAIDPSNNLIVLEENGQRLLKFDPNGNLVFKIGTPGIERDSNRGTQDNQHFSWPHAVAADKNGNIYVADNTRVQIYSGTGTYLNTIGGSWGSGDYQFSWASGIAVDTNGNIFVADAPNQRVQVYNNSRIYVATLGMNGISGSDNAHFKYPNGIEVDSAGSIYVADFDNCRVQKFNSSRVYQMTFGTSGSCTNSLFDVSAVDVTVDAQGRVYVAGWDNRAQVFNSSGAYLTTIGGAWGIHSSQFRGASGVAVDSYGNVSVSDSTNARIQKFAPGVPGWQQANINGFGDPNYVIGVLNAFNGKLYAGVTNWNSPPQIWQSADGKSWSNVSKPGENINNKISTIIDMFNFNGQMYAATGWRDETPAAIWRTPNGTDWTAVTTDGFGISSTPRSADVMTVYQGQIYAAVSSISDTSGIGAYIYRSSSGDPGSWSPVVTGGNGDIHNALVNAFAEFNGALYACGKNMSQGAFIWKSSPDGSTWSQVASYGLDASQQDEAITMTVFNGKLYVGTYNINSGKPGQVWSSANGSTWSPVIQDGFGNASNLAVTSLYAFDGALYAIATNNEVTGNQVWKSKDGVNWTKAAPDGLGNSNNIWMLRGNAITSFNGSLYLAWQNQATGVQIWRMLHQTYIPMLRK